MGRLEGKVAFISGAGSGIARASASQFAVEGARVILAELNEERGKAAAEMVGDAGLFVHTDVTDEASVSLRSTQGLSGLAR